MSRHILNDEINSISNHSNVSLPSLLNIKPSSSFSSFPSTSSFPTSSSATLFHSSDFSKSIPMHFGGSADIWGSSTMLKLPKYRSVFEDTPEEAELKRQQSLHELEEKTKANEMAKKSNDARVRKNSLLGLGYNYHSQSEFLKTDKKPRGLKPAKKISKHSTTIRKLRPEQKKKNPPSFDKQNEGNNNNQHDNSNNNEDNFQDSQPKRRHSRIPGPLPRVLQRAKVQRMINRAQENLQVLTSVGLGNNENQKLPIKKTLSLKDAGRDVIAGIRYESMNSKAGIKNWEKYFGEASKTEFYRQYHVATK